MAKVVKLSVFFVILVWAVNSGAEVKRFENLNRRYGGVGSYRALVIGIDTYSEGSINGSNVAVAGARAVAKALTSSAGFEVRSLYGAAAMRETILSEIRKLSRTVGVEDNVLIYFSGASRRGEGRSQGWWLPVDASAGDPSTWLSGLTLQEEVNGMKARDVLILSDAVLADGVFGATHKLPKQRGDTYYLSLFNKRSRWAATSGNLMPKAHKKGASLFSKNIVKALSSKNGCLTTMEMMEASVSSLRTVADFTPRCRSLKNTGDQGGEFVFLLENKQSKKIAKGLVASKPVKKKAPVPAVTLPAPKPVPKKGRLDVAANVRGAEVMVDGHTVGQTPLTGLVLAVGSHRVRISKDGYLAWKAAVNITGGKSRRVSATLKSEPPKTGKVFVTLKPASAKVTLDGKPFKSGTSLKVGRYTLKIFAPLYTPKVVQVDVAAGRERWVEAFLSPVKSFKGNWGHYVYVAPGSFRMGSARSESRRKEDEVPHPVTLSRGFFIQSKEVTISQWQRFAASSGYKTQAEVQEGAYAMEDFFWKKSREYSWQNPGFKQSEEHPVTCITYADALAFIKWLNKNGKYHYRLPTEAEWEYAARAGSGDAFSTGSCISSEHANLNANVSWGECSAGKFSEGTTPVGSYAPNSWGLFDMHGNVAEWCRDWYGSYPTGSDLDPLGPSAGTERVTRGGGWVAYAYNARSAHRGAKVPEAAYSDLGMRLVVDLPSH